MEQFPYVFFLGIGGIGMSALARWFHANGHQVSGYDKTETPLTLALEAEGVAVHYADAVANIPVAVRENRAQTLVVLTPAIPAGSCSPWVSSTTLPTGQEPSGSAPPWIS